MSESGDTNKKRSFWPDGADSFDNFLPPTMFQSKSALVLTEKCAEGRIKVRASDFRAGQKEKKTAPDRSQPQGRVEESSLQRAPRK